MSTSIADGRSSGNARTLTVSRWCSSVPPSFLIASDSPTNEMRHVDGHLLGHLDHEEVGVDGRAAAPGARRRAAGCTGVARWLPTLRSRMRVAAGVAAQRLELLGIDLDGLGRVAVAVHHGGQDALRGAGSRPSCR